MTSKRRGIVLLVFLTCCHVLGILLFCKGFLLKRVVVPEYSSCSLQNSSDQLPSCNGHVRRYKRVVWLLVDALRYDFADWDDTLNSPPIHKNKMVFIRDLLHDHPSHAKLFKFIADPPTTTMQRLKALTTGGLPTFIDIGSNFNSYEVLEDNLIRQVSRNGRNVTFMGDDTWLGLYPDMLTKVFAYPSLNVKDIHTVDNGVLSHLFSELALRDADLLVGHFLGVDHIGHTYGPTHWTIGEKLIQMDKMVKDVVEVVDNETIVLVFGDHGMTASGDHGGETELETHAALLVYSKQPLFHPQQPSGRPVYQIDLVPTVALLLGLPIPFSNLGMLIPELFLSPQGSYRDGYSDRVTFDLLTVLRINAQQIHNYLITYAQYSGDFPQHVFTSLANKLSYVESVHSTVSHEATSAELTAIADGYVSYMSEVKEMCHQVWAKFDKASIWYGLALVTLSVLAAPVLLVSEQWWRKLAVCVVVSAVLSAVLSATVEGAIINLIFWTTILTLLSHIYTCRVLIFKLIFTLQPLSALALLLASLHAISLLSNSFILYEGDMVAFFLQTLIFCLAVKRLRLVVSEGKEKPLHSLIPHVTLSLCIRVTKAFYSCRDMQYQDGCQESTFTQSYAVAAEILGPLVNLRLLLSCVTVVATPIIISRVIARNNYSKCIGKGTLYLVNYGLPLAGLCVCGHWCLQLWPPAELSYWEHVTLPWVVYLVCTLTLVMAVWSPVSKPFADERRMEFEPITALVVVVVLTCVWVPLSMVLNDGLALSGGLIVLQAALSLLVLSNTKSSLVVAVFWGLLASHSFFGCAHSTTVTSLRFERAFTGIHGEINKFNLPLAGALVGLNTLGFQIMFGLGAPLVLLTLKKDTLATNRALKLIFALMALPSLKLLVSMCAAFLHRRHLMVWQVFTPRVLYEGAFQATSDIALLVSLLVANRVESLLHAYSAYQS